MIGKKIKLEECFVYHVDNNEMKLHPGVFTIIGNYSGYCIMVASSPETNIPVAFPVLERRISTLLNLIANGKIKGSIIDSEINNVIAELKDKMGQHRIIRDKLHKENQELKKELCLLRPGKIEFDLRNELSKTKKEQEALLVVIRLLNT